MTQQTTIAERISTYLRSALDLAPIPIGAPPTALSVAAAVLAAEIDAKDRRIAELEAKIKEVDDNTDFVEELRQADRKTLAETQRLLAVAHAEIARLTPIDGIYQAWMVFAANPTEDAAVTFTEIAVGIAEAAVRAREVNRE